MSKILAIDFGTKNIGLAISDESQKFAFPYQTLTVNKKQLSVNKVNKIISDIENICQLEKVERIIVGLPINLAGERTKMTERVFDFVRKLEEETGLPVEMVDERLTTVQAEKLVSKNARNIDELSAQILLQGWLDRNSSTSTML
jgi:putative Holliday junction resolvase